VADFLLYIHLFVIAVGVGVSIYKLVDLVRSPRRPALWALWSGIFLITLALASGLRGGDRLLSADIIWIIQHLVLLGSLLSLEWFFWLSVRGDGSIRRDLLRHGVPVIVLAAAMTVGWVVTVSAEGSDFLALDFARDRWALAMMLFYIAAFGSSMVSIARFAWRWAAVSDRPWLRRGLRTLTVGCWVSLAYACHKIAYTLLDAFGSRPPWPQTLETIPVAVGVLLSLTGIALPAVGPAISGMHTWIRLGRSYHRLHPLWNAAVTFDPDVALPTSAPWWDYEFRLYRRVVEIWDGRLAIRDRIDPVIADKALNAARERGLGGDDLAAAVEAECWRAALRSDATPRPGELGSPPATGTDLVAECAFLLRVARFMRGPSIVAA